MPLLRDALASLTNDFGDTHSLARVTSYFLVLGGALAHVLLHW